MKNGLTLFRFEFYKIVHARLTAVVLILMIILSVLMGFPLGRGDQTRDVHSAMLDMDGKKIDNALMADMCEAIDITDPDWNPSTWKWTGILYTVSLVNDSKERNYTADSFYELRDKAQKKGMKEAYLTEEEMSWWEVKEKQIEKPFTYVSAFNARSVVDYIPNILLLSLLLSSVCLSGVFAGEHQRGMDQIVLSTRYGRKETLFAKLMAGFSFIVVSTFVLMSLLIATVYVFDGLSGLKAMIQMEIPSSAYPLTFLQFFRIQLMVLFSGALLFAAVSMALSEIFRNAVAVMGFMIGTYLATQFIYIPKSYRVISQAVQMIPTEIIYLWTLHDHRLVKVFGRYHMMFQISSVSYLLISLILCLVTWRLYSRFQVTGR